MAYVLTTVRLSKGQQLSIRRALNNEEKVSIQFPATENEDGDLVILPLTKTQLAHVQKKHEAGAGARIELSMSQINKLKKIPNEVIGDGLEMEAQTRRGDVAGPIEGAGNPFWGTVSEEGDGLFSDLAQGASKLKEALRADLMAKQARGKANKDAAIAKAIEQGKAEGRAQAAAAAAAAPQAGAGFMDDLKKGVFMLAKSAEDSKKRANAQAKQALAAAKEQGRAQALAEAQAQAGQGIFENIGKAIYRGVKSKASDLANAGVAAGAAALHNAVNGGGIGAGEMSNVDIDKVMKNVPGFVGTVPHDELSTLKTNKRKFQCGVFNLENSGQPGSHWVAWLNDPKSDEVEYFDSYGVPPDDRSIKFLKKFKKPIGYSDIQVQKDKSEECGHYCIFYLKHRASGKSAKEILDKMLNPHPSIHNEKIVLTDSMVGGDYSIDQAPPMVPQAWDAALQAKAKLLPNFPDGASILHYKYAYPNLSYDDIMTAYKAMINRTSYQDPGNPSEAMRTPEEVAADNIRQKAVGDAFTKQAAKEAANQVTNDALNRIHQGVEVAGPIVSAVAPGAGEALDLANTATSGLAGLLNLPSDLSNEASGDRIAQAVLAAKEKAQGGGGLLDNPNDINGYLPDLNYLRRLNDNTKEYRMASSLQNTAANYFSTSAFSGDKTPFLNQFKAYGDFLSTLTGAVHSPDYLTTFLPPVEDMQTAFGSNPDLMHTLMSRLAASASNYFSSPGFSLREDRPAFAERLAEYHQMIGGHYKLKK